MFVVAAEMRLSKFKSRHDGASGGCIVRRRCASRGPATSFSSARRTRRSGRRKRTCMHVYVLCEEGSEEGGEEEIEEEEEEEEYE